MDAITHNCCLSLPHARAFVANCNVPLSLIVLFVHNQNFSVCDDCSELCHLYHNLHHQKQKLYVMCSEIVEKRKTSKPGIDTTQILNQLLADDSWLESVKISLSFIYLYHLNNS